MRLGYRLLLLLLALPASADGLKPETELPSIYLSRTLAFSPDGKTLIDSHFDETNLWETATWGMRASFPLGARSLALT
jgi:hypothetical protein